MNKENDNDLISRSELKKAIIEHRYDYVEDNFFWTKLFGIIDNAPTVEYTFEEAFQKTVCEQRLYCPAKPQGEWTTGYSAKQKKVAVCNLCNCISFQGKTNFCPNCGADMRKGGAV